MLTSCPSPHPKTIPGQDQGRGGADTSPHSARNIQT